MYQKMQMTLPKNKSTALPNVKKFAVVDMHMKKILLSNVVDMHYLEKIVAIDCVEL